VPKEFKMANVAQEKETQAGVCDALMMRRARH
jgi:hypothetical protein